jgi:O-antigen biosynthesis protein
MISSGRDGWRLDVVTDFSEAADDNFDDQQSHMKLRLERAEKELAQLRARRSAEAFAAAESHLTNDRYQYQLARRLQKAEAELATERAHVEGIHRTRIYRYTERLRRIYFRSRTAKKEPQLALGPIHLNPAESDPSYSLWIQTYDTLDGGERERLRARVAQLADPPLISVIFPIYNTPMHFLTEAIDSIRNQIYPHWELCIVDDCSPDESIAEAMRALAATEPRIRFVRREENGHISAASNTALAMASGEWVAFVDHDDTLAETALALFALKIRDTPGLGVIYSDKDKISEQGERLEPFFKTEFDPLLLMAQNYLCHLAAYRKDLVDGVGGFREGYEGSQDWDLALRVTETLPPEQIAHIPRVLYHWRIHSGSTAGSLSAKSYAADAGERSVRDQMARLGQPGDVIPVKSTGWNRVNWAMPDPAPLVSIVIPTRDGLYLHRCLDSIRFRTTYQNVEILVVDNGSLTYSVLEYLMANESWLTVIRDDNPFNYADINNRAVAQANGDVICLLNDDTEVLNGDWLQEMVRQLMQPSVGAVGAKLYYPDGRIQHAGVILGMLGIAGHALRMCDRLSFADQGRMQLPRCYSAVTAACMAVRREAWDHVGGMDAVNLPVAFNDIDFCLRLGEAGWRVVFTPYAELIHHESISRGSDIEGDRAPLFENEKRYMRDRWGPMLDNDPAYNPNLSLIDEFLPLSWPPRVPRL